MDGNSLRKRRSNESHKDHNNQNDHNDDMQPCPEGRKSEGTRGRTPDGTGESKASCFVHGRVKLVCLVEEKMGHDKSDLPNRSSLNMILQWQTLICTSIHCPSDP